MLKFIKNLDWEKILTYVGYIFIAAVGTLVFGFAFVFAKAIIEAIF